MIFTKFKAVLMFLALGILGIGTFITLICIDPQGHHYWATIPGTTGLLIGVIAFVATIVVMIEERKTGWHDPIK